MPFARVPRVPLTKFQRCQGSDEFLGLQTAGSHPRDAEAFAARIAQAFAKPFVVQGAEISLTASIGFSVFPTDTRDREQLVSNAKLAMRRGKSKQRGSICMYQREMDDTARARRALARDLKSATERGELLLHYQLQTTLKDGMSCGAEALMRWQHPKRGMISPAEFIPLAEETGAIVAMGEWALRTACRDAAAGRIPGLSPHRLEVEVTESTLMSDQNRGLRILRKLKARGISVAMDDFGTGYSSLATLHAFPFDKIKLDRAFVKRLPNDAAATSIVRTVLALGSSLGIPVLREGIETEAQWQFLAREGCAKGQGYLFAKPVGLSQLPAVIESAARFVRDESLHVAALPRTAVAG